MFLSFTVKPNKVRIEGLTDGSVVKVKNGKPLTSECLVTDSRPAPVKVRSLFQFSIF